MERNEADAGASPGSEGVAAARADEGSRRLDAGVVTAWRLVEVARAAVLVGAAVFAERAWTLPLPPGLLPAAAVLAGIAAVVFWPPARYAAWAFRVRDRDLFVRRGVFWRTASIIPHARIQHVDTRRGPLERALGLARVVVYTAGVRGADVTIPGLALADAEALRDRLADLGGEDDGV